MNLKPGLLVFLLFATLQLHAELSNSFQQTKAKAESGDIRAQNELAKMYLKGMGVETNFVEAVKWLRKAADKDDAKSQVNLGECYHHGLGVQMDYIEAVKWYR